MRLSTRDLFAILTFVALLSWCAGRVGFDNPQYWTAIFITSVLGAIFVFLSGHRDFRAGALVIALCMGGFCTLPFSSLVTLYAAGFLLIAAIVSAAFKLTSARARCALATTSISAAFLLAYSYGNADFRRLVQLQEQFPVQTFESRLAYEDKRQRMDSTPVMSAAVKARLSEDEQIFQPRGWRLEHLRMIHDRSYEQFVRAAGFGIMRMGRPSEESIRMPPLRNIDFADASPEGEANTWNRWGGGSRILSDSPVEIAHDASRFDFLDADGYGIVLEPRIKVAGSVPHAFHHHPLERSKEPPKWSIDRIELVSLLKFDEPRVYVLDHLPRMDQLSGDTAPTRELNEFEASALEKLRSQEDLVVQSEGENYRMLGSLRAAKQCLDCHNVQRGELLGAFSYRLTLAEDDSELEGELVAKGMEPNE
jgi:hypothetical protein